MSSLPTRLPRLSPSTFRRITLVVAVLLAVVIVTGAAVRLTGSGLGCPDWPNCDPGRLIPRNASNVNAEVEFLNRVFTALVSIAVGIAVVGSWLRVPRRRDLCWLSLSLIGGFVAQAVLGGFTVLYKLAPQLVMAHFLLSLVLLAVGMLLHRRAGQPSAPSTFHVAPAVRYATWALLVSITSVVVAGTVVTGSGPHAGDQHAKRFSFPVEEVAKVHGSLVIVFLALVLVTFGLLRRTHAPMADQRRLGLVLLIACAQTAIGYVQYFTGIPALLVGFHVAGATALFAAVVHFWLHLTEREPIPAPEPAAPDVALSPA